MSLGVALDSVHSSVKAVKDTQCQQYRPRIASAAPIQPSSSPEEFISTKDPLFSQTRANLTRVANYSEIIVNESQESQYNGQNLQLDAWIVLLVKGTIVHIFVELEKLIGTRMND